SDGAGRAQAPTSFVRAWVGNRHRRVEVLNAIQGCDHKGKRASAPVQTSLALHQLLVDQQTAQQGEVLVVAAQDVVDLRLRVALSRPEVLRKPAQDDSALLPAGRYLLDATGFHEVGQDAFLPRVIAA